MRKHDVRKWLHAILDLLPVILIPVFMIYSHRHTLTEKTDVDIQYKYQSNEVASSSDLVSGNIYEWDTLGRSLDELLEESDYVYVKLLTPLEIKFDGVTINDTLTDFISFAPNTFLSFDYYGNINTFYSYEQISIYDYNISYFYEDTFDSKCVVQLYNFAITNYQYFSITDYNEIESVSVNDSNSDIMSVFMDDFNNAIDKYFNMGNVFNLGGVYQWFNTNIFSGNAPQVIYSIWNIALYELVMDLLFLLYGLFMWFIDMIQKLMEKPLNSIK